MRIAKFIAMSNSEFRNSCDGGGTCTFTESGQLVADVGSKLPLIIKGNTCVGYALIISITIKAQSTTFAFKVKKISTDIGRGLYNFWQSCNGDDEDDRYTGGAAIPGVYQGKRSATSVDIGDDDDDELDLDKGEFMSLGGFNYKPKRGRR